MRALIVATSCNRLRSGHPTGLWVEEHAVPYMGLDVAGVNLLTGQNPKSSQAIGKAMVEAPDPAHAR